MKPLPMLACGIAVASLSLAGCGGQQQSAAPVEVISIGKDQVSIPSTGDPVHRPRFHVVASGETLGEIALQYGLDYQAVALWNNLPNPDLIEIGQRLQLHPPSTQPEVSTVTPIKASAPTPSRASADDDGSSSSGGVTRTQVGVGRDRQQVAIAEITEPKALKIPYSKREETRLLKLSGGVEQASLAVRSRSSAGAPRNTRDRSGNVWSWPVNGKLSDSFSDTNKGIDISGPRGQPIYASSDGRVIYAGSGLKGYGQLVIIKHANEYLSSYAHNDRIFVAEGETVKRGQLISEMGDTGSDRVGLHFEIRRGSETFDPQQFLPKNP